MKINNVNMEGIQNFITEAQQDPQLFVKKKKITGEWNFVEGQAQFKANVVYALGQTIIETDQAPFLGGAGTRPDPIQYCLFGTCSCFAATFATIAASENVVLTKLRITAENEVDLSQPMGIRNNPIVRKVHITVEVESNADEAHLQAIEKSAMERCPGIYCITTPIPVTSTLIKL